MTQNWPRSRSLGSPNPSPKGVELTPVRPPEGLPALSEFQGPDGSAAGGGGWSLRGGRRSGGAFSTWNGSQKYRTEILAVKTRQPTVIELPELLGLCCRPQQRGTCLCLSGLQLVLKAPNSCFGFIGPFFSCGCPLPGGGKLGDHRLHSYFEFQ